MKTRISVLLVIIILLCLIIPFVLLFVPSNIFPYEIVRDFLMFDHIEYNGDCYYLLDSDLNVPENMVPNAGNVIQITLVDNNHEPYKEGQTEEVWLFTNDPDVTYIYYYPTGLNFTKDKNLVEEGFVRDGK